MVVSGAGSEGREWDYGDWNAEVAKVLRSECPQLQVEHYTQLGGGCQAVIVGDDDTCAGVTDDCVVSYTIGVKQLWSDDDDDDHEDEDVIFACLEPANAAAVAIAMLIRHKKSFDSDYIGNLCVLDDWTTEDWNAAKCMYLALFAWHNGSSHAYYIQNLMQAAIREDAPCTVIYHGGGELGWQTLEDISAASTATTLLNRLGRLYTSIGG